MAVCDTVLYYNLDGGDIMTCSNYFSATPCNFNGIEGYTLKQFIDGVLVVEQFVVDLESFCESTGYELTDILIEK